MYVHNFTMKENCLIVINPCIEAKMNTRFELCYFFSNLRCWASHWKQMAFLGLYFRCFRCWALNSHATRFGHMENSRFLAIIDLSRFFFLPKKRHQRYERLSTRSGSKCWWTLSQSSDNSSQPLLQLLSSILYEFRILEERKKKFNLFFYLFYGRCECLFVVLFTLFPRVFLGGNSKVVTIASCFFNSRCKEWNWA